MRVPLSHACTQLCDAGKAIFHAARTDARAGAGRRGTSGLPDNATHNEDSKGLLGNPHEGPHAEGDTQRVLRRVVAERESIDQRALRLSSP